MTDEVEGWPARSRAEFHWASPSLRAVVVSAVKFGSRRDSEGFWFLPKLVAVKMAVKNLTCTRSPQPNP
jgi:hypothetical protein